MNATVLLCTNDRYCPTADTFGSVEEFLAMCRDCFGDAPTLTGRTGPDGSVAYTDHTGAVVLVSLARLSLE